MLVKINFALILVTCLTLVTINASPVGSYPEPICSIQGKRYEKGSVVMFNECQGLRCSEQGDLTFFVKLECRSSRKRRAFAKNSPV